MSNAQAPYDVIWAPTGDLDNVLSKYTYSKLSAEFQFDRMVAAGVPVVMSKGTRTVKSWFPEDNPE